MPERTADGEFDPKPDDTRATAKEKQRSDAEHRGDLDRFFSLAYEQLHRLAATVKRYSPNSPLSPSTLVNEAWLRLARSSKLEPNSELHFKRIAARAMRRILVEAARRRNALKRGGGAEQSIAFDDSLHVSCDRDLVALDAALKDLALVSPRQASMVEIRFFGGCDVAQTAAVLNVAKTTIERDWRAAKAWLQSQIRRDR